MQTAVRLRRSLAFAAVAVVILAGSGGRAMAAPPVINFQGRVLGADGFPHPGPVDVELGIFDGATGGAELYHESHLATPLVDGVYSIPLGGGTGATGRFDAATFAADDRWLEVMIDGETLTPRQRFTSVAYAFQAVAAAHAATAADADTVDGMEAAALDQSAALAAHVGNTNNPHGVTAEQIGAISSAQLAAHAGDPAAHHARYTDAEAVAAIQAADGTTSGLDADLLDGNDSAAFAPAAHDHDARYYSKAYIDALEARIADLEESNAALLDLLQHFSRSGNDVTITGANLHIVNGNRFTDGPVNGLGNLIVGYNEPSGSGTQRTGSHNVVVGRAHNYSSYGGLVVGESNTISGPYATVIGGGDNTADGPLSMVGGGQNNEASGWYATVNGGEFNKASGGSAVVSGGQGNAASGFGASVSGGSGNTASGDSASVSGGWLNVASGNGTSVSGGESNTASGISASVSGGQNNTASGWYSTVAGGGGGSVYDGNTAFAEFSAILGGASNLAGDPALSNMGIGNGSTISGGTYNTASGWLSTVSGGEGNTAGGDWTAVSGGQGNTASGFGASVSGGSGNTASGDSASVSGGSSRSASGESDWRAGELFQDQ